MGHPLGIPTSRLMGIPWDVHPKRNHIRRKHRMDSPMISPMGWVAPHGMFHKPPHVWHDAITWVVPYVLRWDVSYAVCLT